MRSAGVNSNREYVTNARALGLLILFLIALLLNACGEETATILIAATPTVTPKPEPTPTKIITALATNTPEAAEKDCVDVTNDFMNAESHIIRHLGQSGCLFGVIKNPFLDSDKSIRFVFAWIPASYPTPTDLFIDIRIPPDKTANFSKDFLDNLANKRVQVKGIFAQSVTCILASQIVIEKPEQLIILGN